MWNHDYLDDESMLRHYHAYLENNHLTAARCSVEEFLTFCHDIDPNGDYYEYCEGCDEIIDNCECQWED